MAEDNLRLTYARKHTPSRRTPGAYLGRQELADLVNEWIYTHRHRTTSLDKNYIGKLEKGRIHHPDEACRAALRAILGAANDAQLGFYDSRRMPPGATEADRQRFFDVGARLPKVFEDGSDVVDMALGSSRRSLLTGIAAVAASCGLLGEHSHGRQLGVGDVDRISAVTALYRSVDYEYGGGMLYAEVSRFAESATGLLSLTYSESLGPQLLAAVASARQLAGWTAFDSCRHSDAQRHFLAAERAATAADDPLLAGRIRYCQARQYQHLQHNRDAIETLRLARDHLSTKSTAAVRTMIDGAQAASLAAIGDGKHALTLLDQAETSFHDIDIEQEPDWMHFYDRGELLAQFGRVYRDLARVDRRQGRQGDAAVKWTTEAISAFDPQNARSIVLNEVGLCSAWFLAGEPEQAVAVGARAIERARALASPRIFDRLGSVRHDLAEHRAVSEVAEFAQTLATLGPRVAR